MRAMWCCMSTLGVLLAVLAFGSSAAQAVTTGPIWKILSVDAPTNFKPGDKSGAAAIMVTAVNVGGASTDGSPVTITDSLPKGLAAIEAFGVDTYHHPIGSAYSAEVIPANEKRPAGWLAPSPRPLPRVGPPTRSMRAICSW